MKAARAGGHEEAAPPCTPPPASAVGTVAFVAGPGPGGEVPGEALCVVAMAGALVVLDVVREVVPTVARVVVVRSWRSRGH